MRYQSTILARFKVEARRINGIFNVVVTSGYVRISIKVGKLGRLADFLENYLSRIASKMAETRPELQNYLIF